MIGEDEKVSTDSPSKKVIYTTTPTEENGESKEFMKFVEEAKEETPYEAE